MANVRTPAAAALKPVVGLDKTAVAPAQGEAGARPGDWNDDAASRRNRLRVRTLVTQRWLVLAGEALVLLVMALWLGLKAPYALCFGVIGAGAWVNLLTAVATPGQRTLGDLEAVGQLTLDIVQITALMALTGGAANPFVLLLIVPVTLGAAALPFRHVLALAVLASAASVLLAFVYMPLPIAGDTPIRVSREYMLGSALANVAGIALIAGYVRQASMEAARMALALDVTKSVLSREQRLSALGGLAAAAAHELGTPLATITIVAKEMAREAPTEAVKEDAELLMAQTQRCREILAQLSKTADRASDEVHERLSLRQLVQEVTEPQANVKDVRVEAIVTGAPGTSAPDIWRMPEIGHALTTFVENAVDFAAAEVLVTARFDDETISVEVRDDGPGFAPDILAKLGEPYVTTRPGAEGSRTGHVGMGLGFFIAKTLLERTGAVVTFQNGRPHGAIVSARWPRDRIEAGGGT